VKLGWIVKYVYNTILKYNEYKRSSVLYKTTNSGKIDQLNKK